MVRRIHSCTVYCLKSRYLSLVVNYDHFISLFYYFPIQLSFSPTCLAENIDLSNHFCMLPSKQHLLYGIAGFIKHFGWQRAAIITENGYLFGLVLLPCLVYPLINLMNTYISLQKYEGCFKPASLPQLQF